MEQQLLTYVGKLVLLPHELRAEVMQFIDFLIFRHGLEELTAPTESQKAEYDHLLHTLLAQRSAFSAENPDTKVEWNTLKQQLMNKHGQI